MKIFLSLFLFFTSALAFASPGKEGAAFLEIPIGGRPTALGGAYNALASDAYAPVFNPSGLGFLDSNQFAAMHLSYLDTMSYEFASFVHPFSPGHAIGAAVQYFRPGDTAQTDSTGNSLGNFSGSSLVGSLGYGQAFGEKFSVGLTGKYIQSKIDSYSASAGAADIGAMFRPNRIFIFGAGVVNIGSKLTFIDQEDPLPLSYIASAAVHPLRAVTFAIQETVTQVHSSGLQTGLEWNPFETISLRGGYKTETQKDLSGWTAGVGFFLAGQEFDYTWVPLAGLGDTQYFSLVLRGGGLSSAPNNNKELSETKDPMNSMESDKLVFPREKEEYPTLRKTDLHP